MLAVLEDAIDCYQKYALADDPRGKQFFAEARDWIMSPEKRWLFSFESICLVVDMNPNYIRKGLKRWRMERGRLQAPQAPAQDDDPNL